MFCTNCGKEIADGSAFCTSCGAKLAGAVQSDSDTVQQRETSEPVTNEVTAVPVAQETAVSEPVAPAQTPAAAAEPSPVKPAAPQTPIVSASSVVPPQKSNKTLIYAIGAVAVIVVLILIFGKGSGGYSDYKTLVKDYYNAIYKKDVNGIIKLFDKDIQKELKEDKDSIKDTLDETKSNWDDQYDKGWNKQVKAAGKTTSGKSHYVVNVELDGDSFDVLYIKKVDDKYYLDEDNSLFY